MEQNNSNPPKTVRSRISIVVTVLNEGEGLKDLLDAFFTQSRLPDEVVIVDGGSSDTTLPTLNEYVARFPSLRVVEAPGVNIAKGRNIAVRESTGDIIAVTDGGCRPDVKWLEHLVYPLLNDASIDAVAGRIVVNSQTRFEYYSGLLSTPKRSNPDQDTMFYGRTSAFRRELWERIGGYPEWLYTAEDTLFALRGKDLGARVAYAPDSILRWRPRPTIRKTAKMFYLYGRGNGRINWGSVSGSLYWLRYHLLWGTTLLGGIEFPWLWLITGATFIFLYIYMILPSLREIRAETKRLDREFYVPLIVLTRNIATNIGFLVGNYEYRKNPSFRDNLASYREPQRKKE